MSEEDKRGSRKISKTESIQFIRDLIDKDEPFFILAVGKDASVVAVNQMDGNITLNALAVMHEHSNMLKESIAGVILGSNIERGGG